jgi:ABC-type antimicrobial peptide transport system permease subunit
MPFREILKQTLAALWESKLRSFLTMFGMLWGIVSVILLVGLGIGFSIQQRNNLKAIGVDIAICFAGKTAVGYRARPGSRQTFFVRWGGVAREKEPPPQLPSMLVRYITRLDETLRTHSRLSNVYQEESSP